MKINPVAIQSYQQLNPQNKQAEKIALEQQDKVVKEEVSISPQQDDAVSKLAVKLTSGNYAEFLSAEEKSALELLFSQYNNTDRFGSAYKSDLPAESKGSPLGTVIDVKV